MYYRHAHNYSIIIIILLKQQGTSLIILEKDQICIYTKGSCLYSVYILFCPLIIFNDPSLCNS